jgi:hypothetical protein
VISASTFLAVAPASHTAAPVVAFVETAREPFGSAALHIKTISLARARQLLRSYLSCAVGACEVFRAVTPRWGGGSFLK